jgi:hypothetical protein
MLFSSSLLTENSMEESNSSQAENCSRSALLKSIENFKGGLKPVDTTSHENSSREANAADTSGARIESSQKKLMAQLMQALSSIRPFISKSIKNFFLKA